MTRTILPNRLAPITEQQLAPRPADPFLTLPESARAAAALRHKLVQPVVEANANGLAIRNAAQLVFANLKSGRAGAEYSAIAARVRKLSAATLERWTREYLDGGLQALAPLHKGRVRKDYGWETRALAMFQQPTKPAFSTVAFWLRQEGYETATDDRVRRYLQALPSNLVETSPKRVGRHYYAQNIRPHHRRDLSTIAVGEVYVGDGHREDKYVQHPVTGKHFRPEIWVWLDMKSERVVGWWSGEDESAQMTLFSFSDAVRESDHVPVWAYTDPGSGVVNKIISDPVTGFFDRLGVTQRTSLPGNARGKGLVEGWFRWYEERSGKRFESFCGHCRTDDLLARLETKIRRGEITILSWQQYLDEVRRYIDEYNRTPKDALDGRSPDEVWAAELQRNPLHLPPEALLRPQREVTVRRWEVRLLNRYYRHADLAAYERRNVLVEYDLHDANQVWVRDHDQRLICAALLVNQTPWARENVLADAREKSRKAKVARHQRAIDEIDARHRMPIAAAASIAAEIPQAAESLQRLQDELAIESRELQDDETPEQRFARALALERSAEIPAADARWLQLYQDSAEYHSRRALMEDFNEQNKGLVDDQP